MIEEGYGAPIKELDSTKKAKLIFKWNDRELELANLNFRALGTIINGLTQIKFYKVINIICAKELWDFHEVTYWYKSSEEK